MIDSTNPRSMADNIRKLQKESSGLASRVAALEVTAPKDYSTTETATGQKWFDGREIYQKVYFVSELAIGTNWAEVGTIDGDYVVDIFCCNSEGVYSNYYLGRINNGKLEIYSGRPANTVVDIVAVKYLKTSPNTAPETREDDTEPEEPEEKKTTRKKATK